MKLRLKQGGIVKLQNAAETIPTVIVADPMSKRISQNNHLAQIMQRDAAKAEWERKVEAAEKKADERINNEDDNLASQFMFSGETGEWSRGANTNARRAKYVAEELGLDGNKAFLDSYKKDGKTGAIAFGTTLLTAPIAGEFATYGLLGGAARLAGGMAGSAVGSWGLGKVGDWADNRLGTNWMGTTGRIVGGFAGFGAGMGATTPVLRKLATKGVTLHIPYETFMKLRSEGFHKNADRVAKSLFKTKHIVNPEERLMNEITDVPKGKGWQFHVDDFYKEPDIDLATDRPISTSFNKQYYENGLIKPGKSHFDSSGESDYIWFKEDIPYIKPKHSNIIKGLSEDLNTKTNQLVSGQPNPFPLSKGFDPNKPSIEIYEYYPLGNIKMNPKLRLKDQSVGTWGKVKFYTPKSTPDYTQIATTYHFDPRVKVGSKPISEAERKGWTKQFRNQKSGQISANEYSGLPKGERNNGRYGNIHFIRHMDVVPELTEDGFVQIAPKENFFANFTTDQLMVPHEGYHISSMGKNVIIINPEAFRGTTPLSLDPGDSFFLNQNLKIKPKHVTFISGDKEALQLAKERGFNIESSPKLKILSRFIDYAPIEEQLAMKPALEKKGYWSFGSRDFIKLRSDYVDELRRVLDTRFSRPSMDDYRRLETVTNVPTHAYPNIRGGVPEHVYFYGPKKGYKQVMYDTTSPIEGAITTSLHLYPHPTNISEEPFRLRSLIKINNWLPIKKQGGILKAQDGVPEIYGGELNPAVVKPKPVRFILRTDPITKNTPITHSSMKADPINKEDLGFFISKGSDDTTYNLIHANCSDATGECLEVLTGQDFTSGITTPISVSRKVRKVFEKQPEYTESGGGLFNSREQSFVVPWYDYRKAKDLHNETVLNSLLKKYSQDKQIHWSKEREDAIIKNWWEQHPKLKYDLDENNNVVNPSKR